MHSMDQESGSYLPITILKLKCRWRWFTRGMMKRRNGRTPKNAHPGIHWEIPIVIQGGSWPFRYEIVSDGGASGLEIGGELERELDNGFIVHNVTDEYGTLWWDNQAAAGEMKYLLK